MRYNNPSYNPRTLEVLTSTSGFPLISSCPFGLSSTSILAAAGLGGDDDDAYWGEGKGRPPPGLIYNRAAGHELSSPRLYLHVRLCVGSRLPLLRTTFGLAFIGIGEGGRKKGKRLPPGSLCDCRGCQMPTSNEAQVEKKEGRNGREGVREAYGCRRGE